MIVHWSALFGAGFLSFRAMGNEVLGDDFKHRIKQGLLLAQHSSHGFEAGAPVPKRTNAVLEADPGQIDLMPDGRLLHERAEMEFNAPTLEIEFAKWLQWIDDRIE